ncbi:MAG: type II secretion system F family protein [Planctomycetota bacterium]
MPVYQYKGLDHLGVEKDGILTADTPKQARDRLRNQRVHVVEIQEIQEATKKPSIALKFFARKKFGDLAIVTRQLATLISAGITLTESLGALSEQVEDRALQTAFLDIRERITQGQSFGEALGHHTFYFSPLYINMIKAGEASGSLDVVLSRLADYIQSQNRIKSKVSAAMTYPIIMLVIGVAVVTFLMTFVVPKITGLLKVRKSVLPLPTTILINVSNFFVSYWYLLIVLFMVVIGGYRLFVSTSKGRLFVDTYILKIPLVGPLFRKQAVSRFSVTFATLLGAGLPVLECLSILKNVVNNKLMSNTLEEVSTRILEGADISTPLKKSGVFPPVVGYMIAVGEQTGQLENILTKISVAYDEEIDIATQKLTAMMEPIMIVVLAVIVGFIVLAIVLPILQLSKI